MKIDKNKTKKYITQKQLPIMEKQNGLEICYRTANLLKEQFPNEIMKITPTTIIEYSKENSRLLNRNKDRGSMSGCYAYFTKATPHRIVIKQKTLKESKLYSTYGGKQSLCPNMKKRRVLYRFAKCRDCGTRFDDEYRYIDRPERMLIHGNWAFVDLMCHELAHHRTKGHAKGFKIKYKRHLDYMVNKIISGEFYQ
jgi:hypothetical protein